jgi:hypothetical protein
VSIKDRWVGPREQVLNVLIAYRCYGPDKSSSWLSKEACLFLTASLIVVGENLGTDPQIGRPSSCELCREPFFSGAVDLYKSVDDSAKGCYTLTMWDTYSLGPYVDWAWVACGVFGRVFPCRVYIDSNRRDSRIWVSLVCDSHHIANLTNLIKLIVTDIVLLNTLTCLQLLFD